MPSRVRANLLVIVAALALSGCALFQRADDFGKPLTIENKTGQSLEIVYANDTAGLPEKPSEQLGPGETKNFVGQFNIEGSQCLQGDLIARAGTVEVARIHTPCRDATWTISP